MPSIDITNIDRDGLLEALWNRSKPAAFFHSNNVTPPIFNLYEAKSQIGNDGYADYVCGRAIKTNIYTQDMVDPYLFDRDAGYGAFQEVVDSLK
jgi:hypothetical protein